MSTGGIHSEAPDRRARARLPVRSLAYIELDQGNGGIILNASESGLAIQAVMSLTNGSLHRIRFRVPPSNSYFAAQARVSWTKSSKMAGLEFDSLSSPALNQLRGWLISESGPGPAWPGAKPPQRQESQTALPATDRLIPITSQSPANSPPKDREPRASLLTAPGELVPLRAGYSRSLPEPVPVGIARASQSLSRIADDLRDRGTLALLALLAALSLVLGWQLGHGSLGHRAWTMLSFRAHSVAAADRTAPGMAKIETLAENNRTSVIPFGRLASPTASRPSKATTSLRPRGQESVAFQTWAPSAPVHPSSQGDAQATEASPPALNEAPAARDRILTPPRALAAPAQARPEPQPTPSPQAAPPMLKNGELIYRVDPIYPAVAKAEKIGGTVDLRAYVGPDGLVRKVVVLAGPEVLAQAAENAVRQWRYAPTELYGKPVDTSKEISLVFQPDGDPR